MGLVCSMRAMRIQTTILSESLKGKDDLEYLVTDGRIILKLIL
jgi:hypothetical protein